MTSPLYLNPGPRAANCLGDTLGVDYHVDPLAWSLFLEPCALADATAVGFFAAESRGGTRVDDPEALTHVATLVERGPRLADWTVEGKLGLYLGRYRSTVRQLTEGIVLCPTDRTGCRRAGESADSWRGLELRDITRSQGAAAAERARLTVAYTNPAPLKPTGRRPRRDAWYANATFVSWEMADVIKRYPKHVGWRDEAARVAQVTDTKWGGGWRHTVFPARARRTTGYPKAHDAVPAPKARRQS